MSYELVLFKNIHDPKAVEIDRYIELGGYKAAEKVVKEMSAAQVIETTKATGLRGRGGAGFPTGMKWSFVPKDTGKPIYLCCNADESEPGTCKDRVIIERDPHQLIEGMIIAALRRRLPSCIHLHPGRVYVRISGSRSGYRGGTRQRVFWVKKIFGSNFDFDIVLHSGAGAYICGEETGLIESLEGKRGHPRQKPPFPAVNGLYSCPTVVNNVETLANLPHIFNRGAEWFKSIGSNPKNTGPKLYCVSGHVNKPAVVERELGIPLPELIYDVCGGIPGGRKLKGVIPGGSSVPILTADEIDVQNGFRIARRQGNAPGLRGVMVIDDSVCMVRLAMRTAVSMPKRRVGSAHSAAKAPGGWSRCCTASNTVTAKCRISKPFSTCAQT